MSKRKPRPWTDEEIGFLEANADLPAWKAGEMIDRSESSVWAIRSKMRRGTVTLAAWSEDELDFLRATPHLTIAQHAEHLGRKESTIVGVRQRLSRREGIAWGGYSKSPFHVGSRRLLAKTCNGCGLLLDGSWFVRRSTNTRGPLAGHWFARCIRCCKPEGHREKDAKRQAERRKAGTADTTSTKRLQAISLTWAERSWQPYTEADMETLSNPDLTDMEKAFHLKRTLSATRTARSRYGFTSRVGKGDPMKGVWVIDNPNEPKGCAA